MYIVRADVFSDAITSLNNFGFFSFFLPFVLTLAVFYGLLRKSRVFGEPDQNIAVNIAGNGVIAIVAAFMVWAYPVLAGVPAGSVSTGLSKFFFESAVAMMTITVGLLLAGFFLPPDLPGKLSEKLGSRGLNIVLLASLLIGGSILFSSQLVNNFIPPDILSWISTNGSFVGVAILMAVTVGAVLFVSRGKSS